MRWARAQEVFHAALDLPGGDRAVFVASSCGEDHKLRDEVTSLLASDAEAGEFIERPAIVSLAGPAPPVFTSRFAPGDVVGRYAILAFLGAGGLSEVYRARDTRLGRDVALKLITDPDDDQAGQRLLIEAQHVSVLNHPNICAVYEAEDRDGLPFIVLELVEGPTLHDVLGARRVTTREAIQWASDVAAALDHAHRRGIIHRDLKSANVALAPDGRVKVLDFGLSRRISLAGGQPASPGAILSHASVVGTLTHMAPEVLKGEPLDHRVDLWALGVMLYEMTSRALPFKRSTPFQTAEAILEAPPEPLPASVPRPLRRVVQRCLEKDPSRRFQTAAEVREALASLQPDGSTTTSRMGRRVAAVATVVVSGVLSTAIWSGPWTPASPGIPAVLAVLPFENASADASQAFFADGTTEALISELGRIDGIRAIGAPSTRHLGASAARSRDLARGAGATRLLEGSVKRTAHDVALSARLVDASTGRVLWAETYQRDSRDVQALHALVAATVARAAQVDLTAEDARHVAAVRAVDPDVYEAYLKGRYHWNQRTTASIRTAVAFFETALKLDPTFAPAYAALADCYNQLGTVMVGGGSSREWRPRAAEAAVKALQIEPSLAEAHATLGYVGHYDWQWQKAEASFRRAIGLNPSNPLARVWYANLLCSRLRLDEAVREVMTAKDLDPYSLVVNTNVGWVLFMARRNDEAIEQFTRTLAIDPTYPQARSRLAGAYLRAGRFDEAIHLSAAIAQADDQGVGSLLPVEQARMLAGRPNEFERLLDGAVARLHERYMSPGAIANYYFSLGGHRDEDGFRWLEQAHRERANNIAYLAVEPSYDRVRQHPRFTALVRAVGLP